MRSILEKQKEIPVIATPDVLVVGSGPAGIAASIASARTGAKTMLIERYGFIGGNLTTSMVNPIFTFHDINGRQIIKGIAEELILRMREQGSSPGHVTDLTFDNASMTPFDPEGCKVILFNMMEEAKVQLLLHTLVVNTQVEKGRILSVIIENKSGRQAICPRYVIDCSGDADVAVQAGAEYVCGKKEDGSMQPATLYFRIGGVNNAELRSWMKKNSHLLKGNPTEEEIDNQKAIAFLGMNHLVNDAIQSGDLDKEIAPRILMYELPHGEFSINCTRLQNINGSNADDLTKAEIRLRKQVIQVYHFIKKMIGGFENSYVVDTGIQVGIRETRHIVGDHILTEEEVLNGTSFIDGIACGTFAIDIHPPHGKEQIFTGSGKAVYEIPYRCMLPVGFHNLIVAGRSISATHTAAGSIRVMATCMAIGQAAGTSAAILSQKNCSTREIDIPLLRKTLLNQGQYLLNEPISEEIDERLILKRVDGNGEMGGHYNPFSIKKIK
ncbi:FAD-dependent oxidoreductase [Parabacteroides sp. Marseille-P3160]|uniref:FAD-dependent oxidoreductase n=1 Tax=Parabacteroides sp. Marseille-P3160 TaxID=1917887 RepID=UPI0009BB4A18|nr:FAD-dependent oxidoreductase [Parabacteroides sp. Marseille-P3160]